MNWPTPRHSARIARVEYRRLLRSIADNPVQLLAFGFFLLVFVGGPTVGGAWAVLEFGEEIRANLPLLSAARGGTAVAWIGLAVMATARTVGKTGRIDQESAMLTTVPARDVLGGLVLTELARMASVAALPVLAISAAWAVALGAPATVVAAPLTVLALLATAVLAGHIVGMLLKIAFAQSELLARYRTVVFALAFLVYMAAITSDALGEVMLYLGNVLRDTPMAWFGDALLVGTPGVAPSLVRAGGAVAFVAVTVPVLLAVDVRVATRLWYADRVHPESRSSSSSDSDADFLAGVVPRRTRTVTATVWRRTKRSPLRLLYAAYPLFFLITPLRGAVESGSVPTSLPVFVAFYGTWVVGATALNPLGDEGAMLPVTITSGIDGGQFVRGHVLAATLVGLPLVVVATAVTGLLSPLSTQRWVALTAASAVVTVTGSVVALGVGTAFPRFSEVRVTRSREVVVPSKTAFALYSLVVVLGFGGAAVAIVSGFPEGVAALVGFFTSLAGFPVDLAASTVRLAAGATAVLLGVVAPPVAYRHAVSRFERFTLDDAGDDARWELFDVF
ncbi:hypothetical protein [Halomicrococcus gelatinilyticus]|uniref:hypothetical protein n=1 Tax=Halomicrococcus gelatinilyticus TaxID=1702103 RepID=UPI002E139E1B